MRAFDSIRRRRPVAPRDLAGRRPAPGVPDPALIAGISFLVPGLGQLLLRAWLPGTLWLAGWVVLAVATGAVHGVGALVLMGASAVDAYARGRRAAPAVGRGLGAPGTQP